MICRLVGLRGEFKLAKLRFKREIGGVGMGLKAVYKRGSRGSYS